MRHIHRPALKPPKENPATRAGQLEEEDEPREVVHAIKVVWKGLDVKLQSHSDPADFPALPIIGDCLHFRLAAVSM